MLGNGNPFNIKNTAKAFMINEDWLLDYSMKWERLTKVQKALICKLTQLPRIGCVSDIVRLCGLKTNNQNANTKQIMELKEWNIISISAPKKEDMNMILSSIPEGYKPLIKIDSRTKLYTLRLDWIKNLMKVEFKENINNRLDY